MATPPEGKDKPAGETDAHAHETTGVQHPRRILSDAVDMCGSLQIQACTCDRDKIIAGLSRIEQKVLGVVNWLEYVIEGKYIIGGVLKGDSVALEHIRLGLEQVQFTKPTRGQPLDQPARDKVSGIARAAQAVERGTITETQDQMDFRENAARTMKSVEGKLVQCVEEIRAGRAGR